LELLDLRALAADDHARSCRREQHRHRVAGPLDLDLGDPREAVLVLDELADLEIFDEQVAEFVLGGVPAAAPVLHDPHAKPGRSNLLAHEITPLGWGASRSITLVGWGRPGGTGPIQSVAAYSPPSRRASSWSFFRSTRPIAMWALRRRIR